MKSTLPLFLAVAACVFGSDIEAQFTLIPMRPGNGAIAPIHRSIGRGNVRLGLAVDEEFGLVLKYLGDGKERRAVTFEPSSLWRLRFLNKNGSSVDDDVVTVDAGDCTFNMWVAKGDEAFRAYWRNIEIFHADMPAGSTAEVVISGRLADDGTVFEFNIDVESNVPGFSLFAVGLNLSIHERGASADQVLALPQAGGTLMPAPLDSISLIQAAFSQDEFGLGEHPGLFSMQWICYYDDSDPDAAVAYFGTRDDVGYCKLFRANVDTTTSPRTFEWRSYSSPPDNSNATGYSSPFPYVLGVLRGDWYDAAAFYREWALQQPWAQNGTIQDDPEASQLVADAKIYGIWTVPRCVSPTITPGGPNCKDIPDLDGVSYWSTLVAEVKSVFGVDKVLGTGTIFWDKNSHFRANPGEWLPITPEMAAEAPMMAASGQEFALYYAPNTYSSIGPGFDVPNPADPNTVPGFSTQPVRDFALMDPFGVVSLNGSLQGNCDKTLGCATPQDPIAITNSRVCAQTEFFDQLALHIMGSVILSTGSSGFFLDNFTNGGTGLCYDTSHGHPLADTGDWIQEKFDYCRRLKAYFRGESQENGQFFSSPNAEFYLTSEGEQEMYIGLVEMTRRTRSGNTQDIAPGFPFRRMAPLFQSVYHGRQLAFDGSLAISGPVDPSLHNDSLAMRFMRQQWAANFYFGHIPVASLVLSEIGIGGSINEKIALYDDYRILAEMMQNYMVVHRESETRDFVLFGERLRDPVLTGVDTVAIEATGSGSPFPAFWPGISAEQPFVYVNAHRVDDAVGIAFMNWTAGEDDTTSLPNLEVTDSPGDQTITYTIDPADYGMTEGMYEMTEVLGDSIPVATLGTVDFTNMLPQALPITVPGRTMRFIVFRPM